MRGAVLEAAMITATQPVGGHTDHQLVSLVRAGDDRAFEELYDRYRRRITAYVYGMVSDHGRAEDITQEVFVSALRRMRETERPIAFRPWVYEIAKNACIDAFRRRGRSEEVSIHDDGLGGGEELRLVSSTPAPDAVVETKQRLDHLCGAFGGLSEVHHEILVLRELEGLSYREIGERMGLSRPAVESTLFRARRRLTQEYDELTSGARCARVQEIISCASTGALSGGDRRRMARHVAACHDCRRHARSLGVATAPAARGVRRIAALLPLPLPLLGRRRGDTVAAHAHGTGLMAQVSNVLPAAEPLAGSWGKAAATLATLALAGFGAGSAAQHGGPLDIGGGSGNAPAVHALAGQLSRAAAAATAALRQSAVPGVAEQVRSITAGGPAAPTGTDNGGGAGGGRDEHGGAGGNLASERPLGGGAAGSSERADASGAGGGPAVPDLPKQDLPSAQRPDAPTEPPQAPTPLRAESPNLNVTPPKAPSPPDANGPSAPSAPDPSSAPKPPSAEVSAPKLPSAPDTSSATDASNSLPSVP
jgi:RNA polymerase sigma factor (sigma-70 family)